MSIEIKKYDENNNLIYFKLSNNYEYWGEYDENNNYIYSRNSWGYEFWREYDKNNNLIHYKNSSGNENWYKYNELGKQINITKKEYKYIEFRKQEKEYLSRTKCSRFEIMDI